MYSFIGFVNIMKQQLMKLIRYIQGFKRTEKIKQNIYLVIFYT